MVEELKENVYSYANTKAWLNWGPETNSWNPWTRWKHRDGLVQSPPTGKETEVYAVQIVSPKLAWTWGKGKSKSSPPDPQANIL